MALLSQPGRATGRGLRRLRRHTADAAPASRVEYDRAGVLLTPPSTPETGIVDRLVSERAAYDYIPRRCSIRVVGVVVVHSLTVRRPAA